MHTNRAFAIRLEAQKLTKDCIAKMLGYKDANELMLLITGQPWRQNFTLSHLLTDLGLSLHGSYNTGKRQDILT